LFVSAAAILLWRISDWRESGWVGMEITRMTPSQCIVTNITVGGPAHRIGVPVKEQVIAITNISVDSFHLNRLEQVSKSISIGDTVEYTFLRNNSVKQTYAVVVDSPLQVPHIFVSLLIGITLALLFLILGVFVYWKKANDRRTSIFSLMALSASAYFFLDSIFLIDAADRLGFLPVSEGSLTQSALDSSLLIIEFLPIIFLLHLSLVFPKERPLVREKPEILRWMYWFPLLLIPSAKLFYQLPTLPNLVRAITQPVVHLVFTPLLIFIVILYPISTCLSLVRSYQESDIEEKRQVKWPLWGSTIAVAGYFGIPLLIALLQGFTGEIIRYWLFDEILPKVFFLLIPVSFAFAILKYRLMDIDLIIKRTIAYSLLSGIVVVVYFSLIAGLGVVVVNFLEVKSEWVTIGTALVIFAVFVPVRTRVQTFVDRRFFREKYDYPRALRLLGREISVALDLQKLLKSVTEQLQQTLQNRSVVVFTKSLNEQTYTAVAKVGVPDEVLGKIKFSTQSFLLSEMRKMFEVHKRSLPEDEQQMLRALHAAFIVPVYLKNELLAFFSLGAKLSDEKFDENDREFLSSVCDQLAVGIYNLQLARQEEEYEEAKEIQQKLLPKNIPQIEGLEIVGSWLPSRVVGGDYYDVLKLSETKVGICIADVTGKGMAAALLMSSLQASVNAFMTVNTSPKDLCEKLNRVICNNITEGKFITLFFGVFDRENEKLFYCNAGHNPPLLMHGNGYYEQLETGGVMLGVFRDTQFEEGEVKIKNGDRILLYTDGVTEAEGENEEQFGEERVKKIMFDNKHLVVREIQKKMIDEVSKFCNDEFQDDVTMVVVSVA